MNSSNEQAASQNRPDLYIALVGAAGTDLEPVKTQLKAHLASFDYSYNDIKVSQLISEFCNVSVAGQEEDARIKSLMDAGDKIRAACNNGDGVVSLVVTAVQAMREQSGKESETGLVGSTAFIIDSLKNPEEIRTLNRIYGRNFYTISVYAPETDRINRLANRIAETCHTHTREQHRERAIQVIKEDERRDTSSLSQDVQNTFPKADFFVQEAEEVEVQIKRFVDLIFGEPFTTPTFDEYAMFTAKAASLRSCDLSRQVGAAVFGDDTSIISTGYNEVPYPGGGMWFEGREGSDNRDYLVEFDPNSSEISNIFLELVGALKKIGILDSEIAKRTDESIVEDLLHGEWKPYTIDARVRNLIEFGRVVHAEMHALSEAARLGRSTHGATLYCTTFPCHICARHIIASGISSVVFIEPYPKSLTKKLYSKEITTDDQRGAIDGSVVFRPFQGVSPVLYQRVFSFRTRKNKLGTIAKFNRTGAVPVGAVFGVTNLTSGTHSLREG